MRAPTIAFYAPMKSPSSAVPSGDRTMSRLLMAALEAGGAEVRLASEVRTWSRVSDAGALQHAKTESAREAARLIAGFQAGPWRPSVWFTYHVYYKAPDWIGPEVSRALSIPYVIVEATHASKRDADDWAAWQAHARAAMLAADAVLCLTARDRAGILRAGVAPTVAIDFPPFLGPDALAAKPRGPVSKALGRGRPVQLITVAMMRPGDKRASYRLLARALAAVRSDSWHLTVVGDGAAMPDVKADFANFGSGRVTFAGACDQGGVGAALAQSDLFVWPGIGEAFGMVYLEAQAAGVPVVACNTAGVSAVVRDGASGVLVEGHAPEAIAAAIDDLIADRARLAALSVSAAAHVREHHAFPIAVQRLAGVVQNLTQREGGP